MTEATLSTENKIKIDAIVKQNDSVFHTLADLSRNFFEFQKRYAKIESAIIELRDIITGDEKHKGVIHIGNDNAKEIREHIEASNKYRPMIEESYRICSNIKKSISITGASVLTTVGRLGITTILGYLVWHHLKG